MGRKTLVKKLFFLLVFSLSLSAANIEEIKQGFIKELKNEFENIKIISLVLDPQSRLDEDFKAYEFIKIAEGNFKKSRGFFRAIVRDKKNEKNIFFRYFLEAKVEVLIARRNIVRNKIISAFDYTLASVDFENVPYDYLYKIDEKLISKRNIKKESILRRNFFKIKPLIQKNDVVYGLLKDGQVSILLELKALGPGFKGQIIRLKNKEGKSILGQVIDKNTVLIK